MNKELIKKYKEVFDYWLEGGKVLCYDNGCWVVVSVNSTLWSRSHERAKFVIDDEYVVFRKAKEEGKTVLFKSHVLCREVPMVGNNFNQDIEDYRIETKFKVGETVLITSNSATWEDKIVKITSYKYHFESGGHLDIEREDAQLKPKFKEGDWVWNSTYKRGEGLFKAYEEWIKNGVGGNTCVNEHEDFELWKPQDGDVVVCLDQPTARIFEVNSKNKRFVDGQFKQNKVLPYIGQRLEDMK